MALDGGEDGLLFYRAIAEHWVPLLKPGGLLAVEIGVKRRRNRYALFFLPILWKTYVSARTGPAWTVWCSQYTPPPGV